MKYRVVERDDFKVAGKIITSSRENNIIGSFWEKCKKDGTINRLLDIGINSYTLGLCFGYNDQGVNDYMVGIETNRDDAEEIKVIQIPKSTWLVFDSVGPMNPTLGNTWGKIYGESLPQSNYKQAALPTVEKYYGNDVNADDYHVEIWIPVMEK